MQPASKRIRKYVCNDEFRPIRDSFKDRSCKTEYLRLLGVIAFSMGALCISICQYFLLNQPKAFLICFSVVVPVLMYSQMNHFRHKGWHSFLVDFCYFSMLSRLVHFYFSPHSLILLRIIFIYTNGPLTWASSLWRFASGLKDFDKMASVYTLPSILALTFADSWNLDSMHSPLESLHSADYAAVALGYLFWQFFYLVKSEHLDKAPCHSRSPVTSLRWLSKDDRNSTARKGLELLRKLGVFGPTEKYDSTTLKTACVFAAFQWLCTVVIFAATIVLYNSQRLHLFLFASLAIICIYFGASYFMLVITECHNKKFKSDLFSEVMSNANTQASEAAQTNRGKLDMDASAFGHDLTAEQESEETASISALDELYD